MTQFLFALTSTLPYVLAVVETASPVTVVPASAAVPVGRFVAVSAGQSDATRFALKLEERIETDTFVILKPYNACG